MRTCNALLGRWSQPSVANEFLRNSQGIYVTPVFFEQALRAAFEPAEGVGRNEVRPQGETSPTLNIIILLIAKELL
jgi:hypothetical protein